MSAWRPRPRPTRCWPGCNGPHPESVTVKALHGFLVDELINAGQDADMIVVGSRGAGGFTRLMMGSVAGEVAQHAYCPVLLVPPRTAADSVPRARAIHMLWMPR